MARYRVRETNNEYARFSAEVSHFPASIFTRFPLNFVFWLFMAGDVCWNRIASCDTFDEARQACKRHRGSRWRKKTWRV